MKKSILILSLAFFTLGTAQAQHNHNSMDMGSMSHNESQTHVNAGSYDKEIGEVNQRMHEGMGFKSSGNADYDFLKGMVAHHQGAIDMAQLELKYGKNEKAKRLARDIIKAQEKEIRTMKGWIVDIEKTEGVKRRSHQH